MSNSSVGHRQLPKLTLTSPFLADIFRFRLTTQQKRALLSLKARIIFDLWRSKSAENRLPAACTGRTSDKIACVGKVPKVAFRFLSGEAFRSPLLILGEG